MNFSVFDTIITLFKQSLAFGTTTVDATIVSDIRANRLRLAGLSRPQQSLVIISLGMIGLFVAVMLMNNLIRQQLTLVVLPFENQNYGSLVPLQALGGILLGLSLAWSFLFHAIGMLRWWARLILVICYGILALLWLTPLLGVDMNAGIAMIALLLLNLIIATVYKSRGTLIEWGFFFVSQTLLFAIPQWNYYSIYTMSGIGILFASVAIWVLFTQIIISPMMLYIGINMARAAISFGQWSAYTTQRATPTLLYGLAIICTVIRLWQMFQASTPPPSAMIVAIVYCLGVGIVGLGARRLHNAGQQQSIETLLTRWAAWLVIGANIPVLINSLINIIFGSAMLATIDNRGASAQLWNIVITNSTLIMYAILFILALVTGIISVRLWQRAHITASLLLGIICMSNGILFVCQYADLNLPHVFSDSLIIGAIILFMLQKIVRRQAIDTYLRRYVIILVMSILMQQTNFLNNPLSPVLGFAGIAFVAFGFIWDVLFGVAWINQTSPQFPRMARLFGYIGYSLLTVTAVAWAGISQNPELLSLLSGDIAYQGFHMFGIPAIHLLYVMTLVAPQIAWSDTPELSADAMATH